MVVDLLASLLADPNDCDLQLGTLIFLRQFLGRDLAVQI
jgi:hypothetical protein